MAKRKKLTLKRLFKISIGIIIFFTLPSALLFGFVYLKYNETLPTGVVSAETDVMANRMLNALNYKAYKATNYIEWTFKNRHHYKWSKNKNTCEVYFKNYKVDLNFNALETSQVYQDNQLVLNAKKNSLIKKAVSYFNNDSFWLVAPYKVFDEGVKRTLVTLDNNKKALLVTYAKGGTTPGDSYLWFFDEDGKPVSFKMWVSILPINGLEVTWGKWVTASTDAVFATQHQLFFLDIGISNLKTQ